MIVSQLTIPELDRQTKERNDKLIEFISHLSILGPVLLRLVSLTAASIPQFLGMMQAHYSKQVQASTILIEGISLSEADLVETLLNSGIRIVFFKRHIGAFEAQSRFVVLQSFPRFRIGVSINITMGSGIEAVNSALLEIESTIDEHSMVAGHLCIDLVISPLSDVFSLSRGIDDLLKKIQIQKRSPMELYLCIPTDALLSADTIRSIAGLKCEHLHLCCLPILIHSFVPLPIGASSTRISHPPKAVITRSPYLNSDKGLVDIVGAFLDTLQNDRPDFLYPTVVCDPRGVCLGMVYSSAESIRVAFIERQGIYWSRSNAALWIKGLNSGQTQELVNISADCDSDTLRFTVFPCHDGYFCHRRTHSCWGDLPVGLSQLEASIVHRQNTQAESYTHQLLQNRTLLNQKLMEHAEELVEAKTKGDIAEEAYKTLYFLLTRCAADGVTLADIERHISARAQHVVRETPVLLESRVHHQNHSMFPATPIVRSKSAK